MTLLQHKIMDHYFIFFYAFTHHEEIIIKLCSNLINYKDYIIYNN
jgi:hypothetical protein